MDFKLLAKAIDSEEGIESGWLDKPGGGVCSLGAVNKYFNRKNKNCLSGDSIYPIIIGNNDSEDVKKTKMAQIDAISRAGFHKISEVKGVGFTQYSFTIINEAFNLVARKNDSAPGTPKQRKAAMLKWARCMDRNQRKKK